MRLAVVMIGRGDNVHSLVLSGLQEKGNDAGRILTCSYLQSPHLEEVLLFKNLYLETCYGYIKKHSFQQAFAT